MRMRHYCNWKLNAKQPHPNYTTQSEAARSEAAPVLSDAIVQWFAQKRGITASTLIAAGITSAEEYMPQTG